MDLKAVNGRCHDEPSLPHEVILLSLKVLPKDRVVSILIKDGHEVNVRLHFVVEDFSEDHLVKNHGGDDSLLLVSVPAFEYVIH